ncbi:uncharacterized protein LOC129808068 [Phlebotomus papatasi]|uniref:uncharacterized protein LOC129808068 n=1 Tax=Phlebotomus papatasi TaxID=29031 RepID=UPI00248420EF|nr:uncharacterized protein LOC129808068 [Phlebotomus papatasi]
MDSENVEAEEYVQLQAVEVFQDWKLSSNDIERLLQCGINSLRHLEVIDSKTISTIFAKECLLEDAILFRHMLRSWREVNKIAPLPSQPFEFDECDSGGGGVDGKFLLREFFTEETDGPIYKWTDGDEELPEHKFSG